MATIETIEARYNPEHDMIEAGPDVTWAEMVLVDEIKVLHQLLKGQANRIEYLENVVANLPIKTRKPVSYLDDVYPIE